MPVLDVVSTMHAVIRLLLVCVLGACTAASVPTGGEGTRVEAKASPEDVKAAGVSAGASGNAGASDNARVEAGRVDGGEADAVVPVVEGEPLVPAKRFPGNVYAAIVDPNDGTWQVDVVDFELVEGSPLARALADSNGGIAALPAGHVGIPKGWAVGDTWTLVTRAGTVTRKAKRIGAVISEGSGTLHVEVDLGAAPKGAKGPALALHGSPKAVPTIAKPQALGPDALGEGALPKIEAAMRPRLEAEQRGTLRKHPLAAKHVEVFAGRFPGDRTHAIVVRLVPAGDDAAVSVLLFAKADGSIEAFRVAQVFGTIEAFAIADLDGDGLDEIVYEDGYHEGWYLELLHWKKERPHARTLTGDGL